MTPKAEVKLKIVTGGSREDMRDSVGSKKSFRLPMHFVVEVDSSQVHILVNNFGFKISGAGQFRFDSTLNGIEWEDGSGESWNLKGWLRESQSLQQGLAFSAYYRTDRRTGILNLVKY